MAAQRFHGVLRATRVKPATGSQHGGDRHLIAANQPQQRLNQQGFQRDHALTRPNSASISARQILRCSPSRAPKPGRACLRRRTRSQGGIAGASRRNASRPWRLTALRKAAARARRFDTIKPSRALPVEGAGQKCRSKHEPRTTRRAAKTAANSSGRCKRWSGPNEARRSDRETMATLGTTRTYHSTTTAGTHAHEEAVGAFAAHNRRLVGAFHGNIP